MHSRIESHPLNEGSVELTPGRYQLDEGRIESASGRTPRSLEFSRNLLSKLASFIAPLQVPSFHVRSGAELAPSYCVSVHSLSVF